MWIKRDIAQSLLQNQAEHAQVLIGPRQCGKSSLFWNLGEDEFSEVSFDDFQSRSLAARDPAFFLRQQKLPLIIDEVQYVPEIFPEIKRIIDLTKREELAGAKRSGVLFRLTSSDQILMDRKIKESLVGRAGYYNLNTLSVSELLGHNSSLPIKEVIFKGGWPELYSSDRSMMKYLNDYIRAFIEKEIVLNVGVSKQEEFHTVLGMLAARTGQILNYSSIAKDSGVKSVTIKEWVSFLERSGHLYLLKSSHKNLNKRLMKSPKVYFMDTGVAARLQGWQNPDQLILSPQAGQLFETLVLSEIVKCAQNHGLIWDLSVWRAKEGEEIDFVLRKETGETLAIDAKMGVHSVHPQKVPKEFKKSHPNVQKMILVSLGGKLQEISRDCVQVPIAHLKSFLLDPPPVI